MLNAAQKKMLLAGIIVVVIVAQAQVIATSSKNGSSDDQNISSCGFIEDGDSFFYMLKFAVNGIDITDRKASDVTPASEKDSIKDNSAYACLDGLDASKTYYLMIEEIGADGQSVAKTVAKVSGTSQTVVWMSISDGRIFIKNVGAESVAGEGSFSSSVGGQSYRFTLKTSGDTSVSGLLDRRDSGDISTTARILGLEYIDYTADGEEMVATGVSYGYGGTTAAYAGPKLDSYDLGKYIGLFFITNEKTPSIKLSQSERSYDVKHEEIHYPSHEFVKGEVKELFYGYAIVSETELTDWNFDKFTATLYKGDVVYDTRTYDESQQKGDITIVDGAGKTITISSPLTNVAVINSNVPKSMIMMGLDDSISTYYYGSKKLGIKAEELETDRNLGTYYTPSVETLVKYKVEAVICPVSNMTLYSNVEKQCEQIGIKVVRLNCNGTTILDDMTKISKLFGDPESAKKVLNKYADEYRSVLDAISATLEAAGGKEYTYLQVMTSRSAVYNHSSDVHTTLSNVFVKNITEETSLPTTTVTNPVNQGTIEEISKVGKDLTVAILRSLDGMEFEDTYKKFTNELPLLTSGMPAMQNNDVYVLNSNLMSGMYAHIGLLIIVKYVYGLDVEGYEDLNSVIAEFQKEYKQSTISDDEKLFERFGNDYPEGTGEVRYNESKQQ